MFFLEKKMFENLEKFVRAVESVGLKTSRIIESRCNDSDSCYTEVWIAGCEDDSVKVRASSHSAKSYNGRVDVHINPCSHWFLAALTVAAHFNKKAPRRAKAEKTRADNIKKSCLEKIKQIKVEKIETKKEEALKATQELRKKIGEMTKNGESREQIIAMQRTLCEEMRKFGF